MQLRVHHLAFVTHLPLLYKTNAVQCHLPFCPPPGAWECLQLPPYVLLSFANLNLIWIAVAFAS